MKKSLIGASVAALLLTACSNSNGITKPTEVWKNVNQKATSSTENLKENQVLAVFYREGDVKGTSANVYVNGHYHTSLQSNSSTAVAVCADQSKFSSSFTTTERFGKRNEGATFRLDANEISYFKLVEQKGQLHFVKVDSNEGKNAVSRLNVEIPTLSRVPNQSNCSAVSVKSLNANALFAYNKAGYKDITAEGRKEIHDFAQELSTKDNVTKLVVEGHTDPQGSAQYNQSLSQKRAETVKVALQKSGVNAPIEAVGYGKSQPVVTNCDALTGKEKQICNAPNRRVDIKVYSK